MKTALTEEQWKIFSLLLKADAARAVHEIVVETGLDNPIVIGSLSFGQDKEWLTIQEQVREELVPAEEAQAILAEGLPERRMLSLLVERERISMRDLAGIAKEKEIPMNEVVKWGSQRGWVVKEKGDLCVTEAGRRALDVPDADEKALELSLREGQLFLDDLEAEKVDADRAKKLLAKRTAVAKIKSRTIRSVCLTPEGRKILSGEIQVVEEKNRLTSEDIAGGEWRNIHLRQYDVTLEAERIYPAKIHLMQKIIQETRTAFLEMGFTEIVSPQVESAFWDFDALFQPQDHPARDMQDTFYMERPRTARLPEAEIVERVRQTHENGWETGSTGWGYNWDHERARQVVLRTHTTATTIRALADNPNPPRKVFCVGKVYRNEAISYKHLPEFFQVDGVIIDEDANLATLLGTLAEFYRKMGFPKMKFKPAFFPYTEPSAEVFVYMESKKSWIELGGSGVFRPEVTRPFGCNVPVLAWGLGLDRLAMQRYGISDIRELFWSDLDKIKEVSLCQ
ncbi:MAG: phenylalanine--tRNA ligase subunit alpha [Proteobacteria bacterium]|nr:phenylalanine--tRNA ligase subunit alpha [Pseudomonadota bacterium]